MWDNFEAYVKAEDATIADVQKYLSDLYQKSIESIEQFDQASAQVVHPAFGGQDTAQHTTQWQFE